MNFLCLTCETALGLKNFKCNLDCPDNCETNAGNEFSCSNCENCCCNNCINYEDD